MTTATAIAKTEYLAAARAEKAALKTWRAEGADPETRPATPILDEAQNMHTSPLDRKSTRRERTERQPRVNAIDAEVRKLFTDGTITAPATKAEIAAHLDVPRSTAGHACRRLAAAGEMLVGTKPITFWLIEAGTPGERPTSERKTRTRKVHAVKTANGKTVHAAHAKRGDDGTTFELLCPAKITAELTKTDDAVTCKRCAAAAEPAPAE